jgi:hypothetical protein
VGRATPHQICRFTQEGVVGAGGESGCRGAGKSRAISEKPLFSGHQMEKVTPAGK